MMAESAFIVFQYYQQWNLKNSFLRARNVPKKVRFRGLMIQNLSMLKGMKKKSVLIFKARVKILKKCIEETTLHWRCNHMEA